MKKLIKSLFRFCGYDVHRVQEQSRLGSNIWRSTSDPSLEGPMASVMGPGASMQALLEHLRSRKFAPKAILDVGANRGKWSRVAKRVFPEADCFMIEPQGEMRQFLDPFCQTFPGSKWFMAGAGSAAGELTFTISEDSVGSSFVTPGLSVRERRSVPVITINSLLKDGLISMPQLVKVDVEGFELEALRGGDQLFGNTEVFILEVTPGPPLAHRPVFHEVAAFMAERGYYVFDLLYQRPKTDGVLVALDVCFTLSGNKFFV